MKSRFILVLVALALPVSAFASKVAIIDSGTDYMHRKLVDQFLLNAGEVVDDRADNDNNGYVDDVYGWNFAEQNNQVIDYSYLGKFSSDCRKFFEVQTRILMGTGTDADKDWMASKRGDAEFLKELQTFGNFTHGTHVAGCAARDHAATQIFAAKLIPTEVKLPFSVMMESIGIYRSEAPQAAGNGIKDMLFKAGLRMLAKKQGEALTVIGQYVAVRGADVANGSFGTSYEAIRPMIEQLYNVIFKEGERNPAKVDEYTKFFLNTVIEQMTAFVKASPKTLFVFAAGNDGKSNDELPVSPANVKTDNTISVAATIQNNVLANFSNYGEEMVEVAAPGVGIISSIPGNEMMPMSGTSQAAPYVTNVAAEIKNQNPALKPFEVKMILMATVDKKGWLAGKVKTAGVVNPERAAYAAKMSVTMDIYSAIASSMKAVADGTTGGATSLKSFRQASKEDAMIQPLPSLFQYSAE